MSCFCVKSYEFIIADEIESLDHHSRSTIINIIYILSTIMTEDSDYSDPFLFIRADHPPAEGLHFPAESLSAEAAKRNDAIVAAYVELPCRLNLDPRSEEFLDFHNRNVDEDRLKPELHLEIDTAIAKRYGIDDFPKRCDAYRRDHSLTPHFGKSDEPHHQDPSP